LANRIPDDTGDEKPGECKEQDDADPTSLRDIAENSQKRLLALQAAAIVEDEHHQDRDATKTVECRIVGRAGLRNLSFGVCRCWGLRSGSCT
jgi:hypothetical protein